MRLDLFVKLKYESKHHNSIRLHSIFYTWHTGWSKKLTPFVLYALISSNIGRC